MRNLGNGEIEVRCTYQTLAESVARNAEFFGLPDQIPRMQELINNLATPEILQKIREKSPVFAAAFLPEFHRAAMNIEGELLRAYENKEIDFYDVLHIRGYLGKEDTFFQQITERAARDVDRWGKEFQEKLYYALKVSPHNATLVEIVREFATSPNPMQMDIIALLLTLAEDAENRRDAVPLIVKALAQNNTMAMPIYWSVLLEQLNRTDVFRREEIRALVQIYLETESSDLWHFIATLDRTVNPVVDQVLIEYFREHPIAPTGRLVAERLREVAQVAPAQAMELAFAQLAIADNFRASDILAIIATLGPQNQEFARALVDFYNANQSFTFSRAFRRYLASVNPVDCPFMTEELSRLQLTPLDVPLLQGVLKKFHVPIKPLAATAIGNWLANVCSRLADAMKIPTGRD